MSKRPTPERVREVAGYLRAGIHRAIERGAMGKAHLAYLDIISQATTVPTEPCPLAESGVCDTTATIPPEVREAWWRLEAVGQLDFNPNDDCVPLVRESIATIDRFIGGDAE